mmetsp:Transcript_11321/g.31828  ORF Transcript_11321/g.31828 Transcript_11321/m.31828 type:complete len:365 (-) Transcript_11321:100-1194(-)
MPSIYGELHRRQQRGRAFPQTHPERATADDKSAKRRQSEVPEATLQVWQQLHSSSSPSRLRKLPGVLHEGLLLGRHRSQCDLRLGRLRRQGRRGRPLQHRLPHGRRRLTGRGLQGLGVISGGHRREAPAVRGARAVLLEGLHVHFCAIAHVLIESIGGILLVQLVHESVSVNFGEDGGRSYTCYLAVAFYYSINDGWQPFLLGRGIQHGSFGPESCDAAVASFPSRPRFLRPQEPRRPLAAIHQYAICPHRQLPHGSLHGGEGGLQNVHGIDLLFGGLSNSPSGAALELGVRQLLVELIAPLGAQLLRIVDCRKQLQHLLVGGVQNREGGGDHGPRQGAPPGLVGAHDDLEAPGPVVPLVILER